MIVETVPPFWREGAMSYNYIVTAHKATAVTATHTGSFTGPEDLNLLQAKGSNLVISQVTAEGLKPVMDVDVFGRIIAMQLFKPQVGKAYVCTRYMYMNVVA